MGFFEVFAAALTGFYALVGSYGVAIILLTLLVRVLLLPLSIKQTKSMREMQVIQPEVKRIQAKYKGDRQKMNEEMMKLYKEHSVNPFGGCLPLLMQFPVLIGLFYVVRAPLKYMGFGLPETFNGIKVTGKTIVPLAEYVTRPVSGLIERLQGSALADDLVNKTLEVHNFIGIRLDCSSSAALSNKDPLLVGETCGGGIAAALPYLALVLFMGFTTYYQQKQMQASRGSSVADSPQAQQMQMFGRIMPIMLMVFAFTFPTGVVLYWLTTNVWTIAQQKIILKAAPPLDTPGAPAKKSGNGSGNGPPGSSKVKGKIIDSQGKKSGNGSGNGTPGSSKVKGEIIDSQGTAGTNPQNGTKSGTGAASKPHPSSKKKKRR